MKKVIIISLIIIILLNVLVTGTSYAEPVSDMISSQPGLNGVLTNNSVEQFSNTGGAKTGTNVIGEEGEQLAKVQEDKSTALSNDQDSFIARTFSGLIKMFVAIIVIPLNWVVGSVSGNDSGFFQIEKLVFNDYKAFSINFFDENTAESGIQEFIKTLKISVATWYNAIRTLAIIASLCVLIYIGIRMAISSVASEKIKYKRMLKDWFVSLVLVFVLHYVIIIIITFSEVLIDLVRTVKQPGFEGELFIKLYDGEYKGWQALGMPVILLVMVYLQFKFFLIYLKRVIIAAFLIIISPLITITYAIDKADDNKAQAFENWMKEMILIAFIQPMHAILFIIFIASAGEIAKFSTLVALLILWSLSKGEAILRMIFKLNAGESMKSVMLGNTKILSSMLK